MHLSMPFYIRTWASKNFGICRASGAKWQLSFGGVKNYTQIFDYEGVQCPSPPRYHGFAIFYSGSFDGKLRSHLPKYVFILPPFLKKFC